MVKRLSVNKAIIITCIIYAILSISMITVMYLLTSNTNVIWCSLLFSALIVISMVWLIVFIRGQLTNFSNNICSLLDSMMSEKFEPPHISEEESLFYKINHRLVRLYEIMQENRLRIDKEHANLQELISDISHQVKTPIANLKMVNSTLLEQPMRKKNEKSFYLPVWSSLINWTFSCRP